MSDELVDAVMAVIRQHRPTATECCGGCDWPGEWTVNSDGSNDQVPGAWERHQASVLIEELGLREEVDASMAYDFGASRRFVTKWESIP